MWEFYPSAEMQLVYSTAPGDWVELQAINNYLQFIKKQITHTCLNQSETDFNGTLEYFKKEKKQLGQSDSEVITLLMDTRINTKVSSKVFCKL